MKMPRSLRRGLVAAAGLVTLFVAVMGFAHTKPGRPVLRALAKMGVMPGAKLGCPLGYDKELTTAERAHARERFKLTHQGPAPSAGRPALGFVLERSTRDEIAVAMRAAGVECRAAKGLGDLRCDGVPSGVVAAPSKDIATRDLWFSFGDGGRLIGLVSLARTAQAQSASDAFAAVTTNLRTTAGDSELATGDSGSTALAAGLLRQASAEFRFTDYYAMTRATHMADGYLLTEEYRAL